MRFGLIRSLWAVIPAKAGIHRRASARYMNQSAIQIEATLDSYARYRSRWIPAFAGITNALVLLAALSACTVFHPPPPYLPQRSGLQAGETITVKGNENVYTIAHDHNVSMGDLIVLNDLKSPFEIRPGQRLVLPANGESYSGEMNPPSAAPLESVEKNELAPIEPAAVTAQPLAPVEAPPPASAAPQPLTPPPSPAFRSGGQPSAAAASPVLALNRPLPAQQKAETTATTAPAAPQTESRTAEASIPMIWPVQGPILSSFGAKGAGTNNDGINIGAPKGAPVVAAAPGTVAYTGDEMKGFGNLVLIRHQGDWVTAYAHLDRVLVKKDSIVAQGDMIGTVGKTGNVSTPQLHFETRKDGKPVDPAGVIKSAP
ncbi:MAG: LysM peptidoglycan-binding domain-containing M23 family metallopeptidase [Alphaproteobacteria bacterium]|nr:LysM peptidoglycan-binding domain-containing M23 family metallopeptidase [Alphaproteobacteria bacterium]